jgi:hypothetical protein
MAHELVTRRALARELVRNAATKPINVAVPAAVAAAALLLHAHWLLPFAVVVYLAMLLATFFDGDEAERVGHQAYARARASRRPQLETSRFAPPIADTLQLARAEEERIRLAARDAPLLDDPTQEISRLVDDLDRLAEAAQRIYTYLGDQDERTVQQRLRRLRAGDSADPQVAAANEQAAGALEAQLAVADELGRQLDRFYAQMEHITASLATIHGQIVRLTVTEELAAHDELAAQVRSLRVEASTAADALRDAYRDELSRR